MAVMLGCLVLAMGLTVGLVCSKANVGVFVSQLEAGKVLAGCDTHNPGVYRTECMASCGGTSRQLALTYSASGNGIWTYRCTTEGICAYVGLTDEKCGGG